MPRLLNDLFSNGNAQIGINTGGGVLSLKPGSTADHTYMQFYARTATPTTRTGYAGFPAGGSTTLALANEISAGALNLVTTGGGTVQANGNILLSRADFATNTVALGTAAAAGAANSIIRSDATIAAFDATVPTTQAFGDAAATGSINFAARRDHKHAMPAGLAVSKNSGAVVGTRPQVNLIEGANITLTVADNSGAGRVDVTVAGVAAQPSISRTMSLMGA